MIGSLLRIAATTGIIVAAAMPSHDVPQLPPSLPFCAYPNGNLDGRPCIYVDPDTGARRRVESTDYRQPKYPPYFQPPGGTK
ncbi:hypothetical protein SEA_REDRAIDER77_114 [Mycobacterium phage RedRaider77]|uniref:Uncharacterized protein n=1 Tax=Mycobacterium phage RedRaider77 TaxID=2500794 RepID=A0A411AYI9_9CAUD|nr:hypothetical protein SEA_REDRAIDER77_114 [Mycobacterium phage RedRaider77]